ncbi:MAG: hypothetical protein IJQ81_16010 [Oscillibacter sp.]|nr:hypothetical protein [Oscillibacter sp.]
MSCIIIRSVRRARRKLSGSRGVSIAETLLCVLILLLSTGVTVSTLDLGIRHFQVRTRETEQRLLCNTLSLAVQEYLTYVNKVEPPGDDSAVYDLTRFKTGAFGRALENEWCAFVAGTYSSETSFAEGDSGQIAVKYSESDSGDAFYSMLADKAQYITGHPANDVKLAATIDVSVDRANRRFNVMIRVANTDNVRTQAIENQFIVIPVNPGVID